MNKKFYIEVDEKGNEVKRTQTVHEHVDLQELSEQEKIDVFYQATAELLSKTQKVNMLFDEVVNSVNISDLYENQDYLDGLTNILLAKEMLK